LVQEFLNAGHSCGNCGNLGKLWKSCGNLVEMVFSALNIIYISRAREIYK
jgi:hypothetical protein